MLHSSTGKSHFVSSIDSDSVVLYIDGTPYWLELNTVVSSSKVRVMKVVESAKVHDIGSV